MIRAELLPSCSLLGVELLEHLETHLVTQELFILELLVHHWILSGLKVCDVDIDRVEPHWLDTTFHCHSVYLPAALLHFIGEDLFDLVRDQ